MHANLASITPANVIALQRLVGNRRTARLLQRHERPEAGVQRVVERWRNTDTKKDFDVKIGEGRYPVDASERGGKQNGYADYKMGETKTGKVMTLHSIIAVPGEGTGLGSLMMWQLAKDAVAQKADRIEITMPSPFAVGFYEQLGAGTGDPNALRTWREQFLGQRDKSKYWDEMVAEAAMRQYEREHYADEKYRSWDALDPGERKRRVDEKRAQMNRSDTPPKLLRKIDKFIRDKAVALAGAMRANPQTMLRCAEESVRKRWAHLPK